MARKQAGTFTKDYIENRCEGVSGKRIFYRDGHNGLGLAVDARGDKATKTFVFETMLNGQNLRITIGKYPTWTIEDAKRRARELKALTDRGVDPRQLDKAAKTKATQQRQLAKAQKVTFKEAWDAYIAARKNHVTKPLAPRTVKDLESHLRRSFTPWHDTPLTNITQDAIKNKHAQLIQNHGNAQANQAMRYLRAVLNWAMNQPEYAVCLPSNPVAALTKDKRWAEVKPNDQCLLKQQLKDWFEAVALIENPVPRAYFQFVLLTGCRREEALSLKWEDVDLRWRSLTFYGTKNGDDRAIPLTNYVLQLVTSLPRRNQWVFSSPTSADGRMREPAKFIKKIAEKTGIDISSHGLRKSFATLSEWCELPDGAIKQIMGHKPSGVHERHYRHRPLDLLAMIHQRLEDWILVEAGKEIAAVEMPGLKVVTK